MNCPIIFTNVMDEPHIPILTATGRIPVPLSFIVPGMEVPPHTTETATRAVHETKPTLACPYCASTHIIKKGTRRNKYGAVQLFACKDCAKKFTPLVTKHHTTPLRVIIECLTRYNRLEPPVLGTAAKSVGRNKSTILRAIKNGVISATKGPQGDYQIDPANCIAFILPLRQA